jgi:hypothetical protein
MTRPRPKVPAGVVRSPSRLLGETPRWPSQAVHGPEAARQQRPDLRQSRSLPWVDVRRAATTVTSCVAEPGERRLARFGAQAAERAEPPGTEAARQSAASAGSAIHFIGLQTTRR